MPVISEAGQSRKRRSAVWALLLAFVLALPPTSVLAMTWNRRPLNLRAGKSWIDFRHTRYPLPIGVCGGGPEIWQLGPFKGYGGIHSGGWNVRLHKGVRRCFYQITWGLGSN
jgi:hypothetical protein